MKYSNESILPNNFLAEQAILSIFLTKPKLIKETSIDLKIDSFYFEPHRIIYKTMIELIEKETSVTLINLISKLQDNNNLQKIGGIEGLTRIINNFESSKNLSSYIEQINEKYLRRLIIQLGKQFIVWGYTTSENFETLLEKMEQSVYSLSQQKVSSKIYSAAEVIDGIFQEMTSKIKNQEGSELRTAFRDLDAIIQGIQNSDLIIIAGRPSMGKTAFSLSLGKNIVTNYNIPLVIFTLEMSRQQIIYRFLSTSSNVNTTRLKSGRMTRKEWTILTKSMKELARLPIFIDDNPNLTFLDIRSKLRKIFTDQSKKGLVIIDYLQLMKLNFKLENRVQEISHITRNLKILAKEFEIPIILLSQLSRSVESRTNKRPMLSDLRESGCTAKMNPSNLFSWCPQNIGNQVNYIRELKGIKPTFLIYFENGIQFYLTSNHKILSKNGWVSISQLHLGEKIYCLVKRKKTTLFYSYHQIEKITYNGLNAVYDKQIEYFHNYLEDNYILHNSIEQDADVVIMLYREDYYKENSKNSQITELIVAKHRNGAIGTAKLLFTPSITSFQNL